MTSLCCRHKQMIPKAKVSRLNFFRSPRKKMSIWRMNLSLTPLFLNVPFFTLFPMPFMFLTLFPKRQCLFTFYRSKSGNCLFVLAVSCLRIRGRHCFLRGFLQRLGVGTWFLVRRIVEKGRTREFSLCLFLKALLKGLAIND